MCNYGSLLVLSPGATSHCSCLPLPHDECSHPHAQWDNARLSDPAAAAQGALHPKYRWPTSVIKTADHFNRVAELSTSSCVTACGVWPQAVQPCKVSEGRVDNEDACGVVERACAPHASRDAAAEPCSGHSMQQVGPAGAPRCSSMVPSAGWPHCGTGPQRPHGGKQQPRNRPHRPHNGRRRIHRSSTNCFALS